MIADVLQVRFDSPESLRREFEKNIANRGVFVATEASLEVRQPVEVEIVLDYVEPNAPSLTLEGEVVHVIPPEMASSGATPGIAVQFEASATDLRERFEPLLGADAAAPAETTVESGGPERRKARRGAVRVPVHVTPSTRDAFEATSRDLSRSGILISMREDALPVGERVRVRLWHPAGESVVDLGGKVVRQVANKKGKVAAVAVAFDATQAAEPDAVGVIEALREAGHQSRLGGISGCLADLGLANMLQMFGSSAPQGTLVVERDGEQGWVAFADEMLIGAELGPLSGCDALVAMLAWSEGRFHFEATADRQLAEAGTPTPLAGAVLDAVCALDEAQRDAGPKPGPAEAELTIVGMDPLSDVNSSAALAVTDETLFGIDVDQEEAARSSLDKTEEAVLDLAKSGMDTRRMLEVIPEAPDAVRAAVAGLVELGVLVPR